MQAVKSYQKTSNLDFIQSASPEQVVHFLLSQLKSELNKLSSSIKTADMSGKADSMTKVLMNIHVLGTSLDFEKGGVIAQNLFQLYEHIRLVSIKANQENDHSILKSAITVATEIEDGWKSLIELSK
jgi:flagellar protein FliS